MSGTLQIRAAVRADIPAILALLADDDLGKLSAGPVAAAHHAAFDAIDAGNNQLLAVATLEDVVSGCLQITYIPGLSRGGMWRAQIEGVRIAGALRGGGLGTQFLQWAIERCRERGCGLVQLMADKSRLRAHRFYRSLGFTDNHIGFRLYL